jgi:hypothetical protein
MSNAIRDDLGLTLLSDRRRNRVEGLRRAIFEPRLSPEWRRRGPKIVRPSHWSRICRLTGDRGRPWPPCNRPSRMPRCLRAPGTGVPAMVRPCARPSPDPIRDQGAIADRAARAVAYRSSRPANEPGKAPGASVTDRERTLTRGGSREGSRTRITSRVTGSFGHQARKVDGTAALISHDFDRPPGIRGAISHIRGGQALRDGRAGAGWARRATPRASRSAWTALAAATNSGSRVTVPATQSM